MARDRNYNFNRKRRDKPVLNPLSATEIEQYQFLKDNKVIFSIGSFTPPLSPNAYPHLIRDVIWQFKIDRESFLSTYNKHQDKQSINQLFKIFEDKWKD